jgi:regulatory protein
MAPRRTGASLDPAQRRDSAAARAAAVACLARRDYARAELGAKLRAGGFDADTAAAVVTDLTREGVLDEERYAHNFVAYHAARGQGPVRIALLLQRLGVAAPLIEAALGEGPDWHALARKARRARFGAHPPADWPAKARQARFLQYRGFSADHIRAATGADPDTGPEDLE